MNSEQKEEAPLDENQEQNVAEEQVLAGDVEEVVSEESIIEALQAEVLKVKDQWLRSVAELENVRKRAERDQAETRKYAVTEFARDLAGVSENMYRALDSMTPEVLESEDNKVLNTLHAGVEMTRSELLRVFEKHGITRIIPARGDVFDHNLHQAVSQMEDAELEAGKVVQVIQSGYSIQDRLLQPAMVVVSKSGGGAPPKVDTTA